MIYLLLGAMLLSGRFGCFVMLAMIGAGLLVGNFLQHGPIFFLWLLLAAIAACILYGLRKGFITLR